MYFYMPPEGSGRVPLLSLGAFTAIMFLGRIVDALADIPVAMAMFPFVGPLAATVSAAFISLPSPRWPWSCPCSSSWAKSLSR